MNTLNDYEFDQPFRVNDDGTHQPQYGVWAPECYHDDETDINLCGGEAKWTALRGWTGQYGYNGAVMHASEYMGGALERHILETPGVYVMTVCDVLSDDDDDPEPAGWCVLEYKDVAP